MSVGGSALWECDLWECGVWECRQICTVCTNFGRLPVSAPPVPLARQAAVKRLTGSMEPRWIWQQRDWPCFRWDGAVLRPALLQASAARLGLAQQLDRLDAGQGLSTAAIEGEQLPPDTPGSPQREASAKVEGLVQLLLASTAELDEPLTLAALHRWHADLFAAGPDGLRAIAMGDRPGNIAF